MPTSAASVSRWRPSKASTALSTAAAFCHRALPTAEPPLRPHATLPRQLRLANAEPLAASCLAASSLAASSLAASLAAAWPR